MASSADYLAKITSEHAGAPKFTTMVAAVTGAFADAINFSQSLSGSFDLDAAVGVQLDAIGLWVGLSRKIRTPLVGVYFSFDTTGLGFEQGVIKGPFDPSDGLVSLDDETYRTILRAKIAANHWDGTLPGAAAILQGVFPGGTTTVFIQDNYDMSMTVGIVGAPPSAAFRALLTAGYLRVKPEGVSASYVVPSVPAPIFGFDVQNSNISGFDVGAFAVPA
jgi:hypothetical protein